MSDDELFADWVPWIGRVENELTTIAWNRRMFRDVSRVFKYNAHLREVGGFVYEWMLLNYTAGVTMAFRREVDKAGHMGFVHLLEEIAKRPQVLSRQRQHDHWPLRSPFEDARRRESFEVIPFIAFADDPMKDHIDPAAVQADIATVRAETKLAQEYVEQIIAHRVRREPETITFEQFNAAIDALTPIFMKYYARLTSSTLIQLEPVRQFNAHLPFTFP